MEIKTIKVKHTEFASLYKRDPNFDLLNFDFHDQEAVEKEVIA